MANLFGNFLDTVGTALGAKEYGLSELFGGGNTQFTGKTEQSQKMFADPNLAAIGPAVYKQQQAAQQNAGGGTLGLSTSFQQPAMQNPYAGQGGSGGGGGSEILSLIDQEYNSNIAALGNQEKETRSDFSLAGKKLDTQSQQATADINDLQSQATSQLDASGKQIQTQSTNALNDARRSYNELQQRNAAQLSAGGLSSSSVAEALGEQLGRKTFDTLNQINQNKDTVLQNLEVERTRANDFYSRKKTEVSQALQQAQAELNNQLTSALNRINEAKTIASNRKAQARTEAITSARNAYSQVQARAAEYEQAINMHSQALSQADNLLRSYAVGDIGANQFTQNLEKLNQSLRGAGVQFDYSKYLQAKVSPSPTATGVTSFFSPYSQPSEKDQLDLEYRKAQIKKLNSGI